MGIGEIYLQSWRITTHCWKLWALMLAVFVVFLPALVLTGAVSGAGALLSQDLPGIRISLISGMEQRPGQAWYLIISTAILLVILSAAGSWILQAAAMRISIMAADGDPISLKSALSLGQRRFAHILKLSIVYGFVLVVLALLPALLEIIFRESPAGAPLGGATRFGLMPLNTLLSLVVLLLLMSVALEDVTPAASFGRSWQVFKTGWWGFLLVMATTLVLSGIPVIILMPLLFIMVFALAVETGWLLLLAAALILVPLSLAASLFSAVFTLVMYTITYRSAARLANGGSGKVIIQYK